MILCVLYYFVHLQFNLINDNKFFGSVVEWLERRDQHALGLKPTRAIPLCPWKRHFTTYPCLVVLAISSKLQSYRY